MTETGWVDDATVVADDATAVASEDDNNVIPINKILSEDHEGNAVTGAVWGLVLSLPLWAGFGAFIYFFVKFL